MRPGAGREAGGDRVGSHWKLVGLLEGAGCVAAEEEAGELEEAAGGNEALLGELVARRVAGEPLAWVVGWVDFAGVRVVVEPGVYVPRWESRVLVHRAAEMVPAGGLVVDLCTGSGAVAAAVGRARPDVRVVATDCDPVACRCARANGVEVHCGHLADPLPAAMDGRVDVVTAVVPYVPTNQLRFLPRDVQEHEPSTALDGGPGGTVLLVAAVRAAAGLLRPGGTLLAELGAGQDVALAGVLAQQGFTPARRLIDDDGDLRGIEAVLARIPPPGVTIDRRVDVEISHGCSSHRPAGSPDPDAERHPPEVDSSGACIG